MSGWFFESHVFLGIYKSYLNDGKEPPIYYRGRDRKEIDLPVCSNGTLNPIEIKKAVSPARNAVKNFGVLAPVEDPEKFEAVNELKSTLGTAALSACRTIFSRWTRKTIRFPPG